jgi:hypothetical protein
MAEVIHMNADEVPDIAVDWEMPLKDSYDAVKAMDSVISIREITPEEYTRARGSNLRVVHSGRRAAIQKEWDDALKVTHGQIVYAEQVCVILQKVGGFDTTRCEIIRKAIAKKRTVQMNAYKDLFLAKLRCGFQDDEIDEKWAQIVKTGDYVFNRSHWLVYHYSNQCRPNCPICEYEKDVPLNASGIRKSV